MGIVAWIILGAVAGWLASIIMGRSKRMGCLANVIAGVLGALVGGFLMSFLGRSSITGLNMQSLVIAVIGAVIVLALTGWWSGRRRR